ncbi:Ger(x)C family spore germination protein [Paenibacillus ferrarius]|uniref:Ger(x)C family spore germination protein n=1 Tax=Paenibacillus ferrarius TaxID=1469647 RepID=UPI003D273691
MKLSRTLLRRVCLGMLTVSLSLLLTGCWDRRELNDLAITSATALDWDGKEWTVSYQVVIPQAIANPNTGGSPGQQAPVMVFSTSGGSIRGAVQKSSQEMPRSLFFSHSRILVIGQKAAEQGISQMMDIFLRNSDSRETISVLLAEGEGKQILEQVIPLEKMQGTAIKNLIENENKHGSNYKQVRMYEFMMNNTSDSPYTLIPEIRISGKGENTTISSLKATSFENKLKLGRIGIFKKDKLIGYFDKLVQYGVTFINNSVDGTTYYFACSQDSTDYKAALLVNHSKSKLKPVFGQDGQMSMRLTVDLQGNLVENGCKEDPSKPEELKKLASYVSADLNRLILHAFQTATSRQLDVFGIADLLHKHYPAKWKEFKDHWPEKFAELTIEPEIHVDIARIGMSSKPFGAQIEESSE